MKEYQVTVCRFGTVKVRAESEEGAKAAADKLPAEKISWFEECDGNKPFLVTYAELKE